MPADQTVEGGAQMRVTQQGFNKIKQLVPTLLGSSLSGGFCIGKQDISIAGFSLASLCDANNGAGCNPGCKITPSFASTDISVTNQNLLNVSVGLNVTADVPLKIIIFGSCSVHIGTPSPIIVDLDLNLHTKPADGELDIHVNGVNNIDIGGLTFTSNGGGALGLCDVAAGAGNFITTIGNALLGFLGPFLTPIVDNLLQGLIPNPLGIAGMMDVGTLLEGISPGTDASMEARLVPGGFVQMNNGGLSIGVITGLNADSDITTRNVGLTSEPNLCVPPFTPPDFTLAPNFLPHTDYTEAGVHQVRPTFLMLAANEFKGSIDTVPIDGPGGTLPTPDILMGISDTTLDLAGHHLVTSGAMCLGVGTQLINQLNVGTIGILVPSVAELQTDAGNDPLLLVTRPQKPLTFLVGDNTPTSPALTIVISHLEVDFYAFLFERYTRAFTLDLTMNVGIGLEFEHPAGMPAQIKPTLVGISSSDVQISVLNSQFVRETPADLEAILPSVFDLVTPLLGDLPAINVPTFAGFTLDNLNISRIQSNTHDFLALKATLDVNAAMAKLNTQFSPQALHDQAAERPGHETSTGRARLINVTTPAPLAVRSALTNKAGGAMPKVMFDVDKIDSLGRPLEWSYNLDGGMFRPFQSPANGLTIADRAFAWQGKYKVGLKSRVKGDYRTTSDVITTPVTIDSVGPRFITDKSEWDGDTYKLEMFDIVSGNVVQWALGEPGATTPATEWHDGGFAAIDRADLEALEHDGDVEMFARDEVGNINHIRITPFHGSPGTASGCNCDSSGGGLSAGTLFLFAGVALVMLASNRRRMRRFMRVVRSQRMVVNVAVWVGLSVTMSLVPGCSCNSASSCELFSDCPACGEGEIAFCIDGTCVCSDDIVMGRLGPYSDVATGPDGTIWVSAYHAQYGDLVVAKVDPTVGRIPDTAWEWVDGVPDGPVQVPQSLFRHGIAAKGEDVGMYTSIAVAPDGTPEVTYFDRDTGSLRFASRGADGTWTHHVIEQGSGELGETGALIGMYTSLTLRTDNGNPGVAYLAHVADLQNGPRAEVRFASAQSMHPGSTGEWMTFIVDTAPLPPVDANNPDIYPLPAGLGLFVDLARAPDQSPVVVYYDRSAGELKVNKFNVSAGQFGTPTVLDGTGDVDAGWSPSVAVDGAGVVHVAYVDATHDDLVYTTDAVGAKREIVDDGRRIVGTTVDGLPKPEYHFVGDDASLVLANAGQLPMIAYQDATTQELLLTTRAVDGNNNPVWNRISVAGHTDPWPGGYGFFASDVLSGTDIVMSTWVVDQPNDDNWVEVFKRQVAIQ